MKGNVLGQGGSPKNFSIRNLKKDNIFIVPPIVDTKLLNNNSGGVYERADVIDYDKSRDRLILAYYDFKSATGTNQGTVVSRNLAGTNITSFSLFSNTYMTSCKRLLNMPEREVSLVICNMYHTVNTIWSMYAYINSTDVSTNRLSAGIGATTGHGVIDAYIKNTYEFHIVTADTLTRYSIRRYLVNTDKSTTSTLLDNNITLKDLSNVDAYVCSFKELSDGTRLFGSHKGKIIVRNSSNVTTGEIIVVATSDTSLTYRITEMIVDGNYIYASCNNRIYKINLTTKLVEGELSIPSNRFLGMFSETFKIFNGFLYASVTTSTNTVGASFATNYKTYIIALDKFELINTLIGVMSVAEKSSTEIISADDLTVSSGISTANAINIRLINGFNYVK